MFESGLVLSSVDHLDSEALNIFDCHNLVHDFTQGLTWVG